VAVLPPIDWVPADVEILDAQEKQQVWLGQAGARVKAAQRESLSIDRTKALFDETLLPERSLRPAAAAAPASPAPRYSRC